MRKFAILLVLGGILLVAGIWLSITGVYSSPQDEVFSIPAGWDYYYVFEMHLFSGATLKGDYTVTSGTPIDLFIFDDVQYLEYSYSGSAPCLYEVKGMSGSFSMSPANAGMYYVVLDHGPGYDNSTQSGRITLHITGTDMLCLGPGIFLLIVGILLMVAGAKLKKQEVVPVSPEPFQRDQSGVLYYQDAKPPSRPPQPPTYP